VQNADDVCAALLKPELKPNLPAGKTTAADAPPETADRQSESSTAAPQR